MSDEEKLEAAQKRKEKGNAQFKAGKWAAALAKYKVSCHQPHSTSASHLLQSSKSVVTDTMPSPGPACQDWHRVADDASNWRCAAA